MRIHKLMILFIVFLCIMPLALSHHPGDEGAHDDEDIADDAVRLDEVIVANTFRYIAAASLIVAIIIAVALLKPHKTETEKWIMFIAICIPVILATFYSVGSTVYLNVISETGGPVHWHADFEIWDCGEFVDLVEPTGLSNRIGTPVYHEHDDNRIHVEGVVVEYGDVDFARFFSVIGGEYTGEMLRVPTDYGDVVMQDGALCDGQEATLQIFVYRILNPDNTKKTGFVYEQVKLDPIAAKDYILAPYAYVPPGDCIIVELGPEKETTTNMCETYRVAIKKGDLTEVDS